MGATENCIDQSAFIDLSIKAHGAFLTQGFAGSGSSALPLFPIVLSETAIRTAAKAAWL